MSYVNINGALARLRGLAQQIISGDIPITHVGYPSAFALATQFAEIDEHLLCGGALPKDWEIGKKFVWRDSNGKVVLNNSISEDDNIEYYVLRVSDVVVCVIRKLGNNYEYTANLAPTRDFPYRIEKKFNSNGNLLEAMAECESYVREQIKNVFDPWEFLEDSGLI